MSKYIKLDPRQVKDFVREASKCDFDVDISYNHLTVDAKSLLGVFGMNFRVPLKVSYRGYNQEFEKYLAEHATA